MDNKSNFPSRSWKVRNSMEKSECKISIVSSFVLAYQDNRRVLEGKDALLGEGLINERARDEEDSCLERSGLVQKLRGGYIKLLLYCVRQLIGGKTVKERTFFLFSFTAVYLVTDLEIKR